MKKTLIVTILLGCVCAYSWAACPKPTDANNCNMKVDNAVCKSCVVITSADVKNKDCLGDGSSVNCVPNPTGGSAGYTATYYNMLDASGKTTTVASDCSSCGSTVVGGPTAGKTTCRTAKDGTDPCPTGG